MDETANTSMQDYYNLIKAEHEANNAWSAEQAQKAMDYQTKMSNTAHQREVADLKAAGLNPVLSAGGSGATTGSGITAQRSDSNVEALYGLAKQAIDAQMTQALAMQNTAKYVSGANGSSTSFGEGTSLYELGRDAFADWLKKKYGISQDTSKALLDKAWNWLKDFDIETAATQVWNMLGSSGVDSSNANIPLEGWYKRSTKDVYGKVVDDRTVVNAIKKGLPKRSVNQTLAYLKSQVTSAKKYKR